MISDLPEIGETHRQGAAAETTEMKIRGDEILKRLKSTFEKRLSNSSDTKNQRFDGQGLSSSSVWRWAIALSLLLSLSFAPTALAWDVDRSASSADLEAFHEAFSFAAYPFAGHGASPLGILGFEVYASVGVDQEFEDEPFAANVVDGSLPGDLLAMPRIGVRKGLPGGFDLGASYARALDSDLEFAAIDLQWALIEGGAVTPAVGLRGTYSVSLDSSGYDLTTYGVEAMISKGFTIVGVYGGVGAMRSEGEFDRTEFGLSHFDTSHSQTFAYAGVTLNLLLPKINVELQQGDRLQGSLRVAFGF